MTNTEEKIMKSILISCFTILTLISCSNEETIYIQFEKDKATIQLNSPKETLTTMCRIAINGTSESDLTLKINGGKPICIPKGKINFWRNYEWYDESKNIVIGKVDSTEQPNIRLSYKFSMQYFGKNVGEGFQNCKQMNKQKGTDDNK